MPLHPGFRKGPQGLRPAGRPTLPSLAAALLALGLAGPTALSPAPASAAARKTLARPEVGSPAPDFSLASLGKAGAPRTLTTLKGLEGQVILMDFWASWCAPCKRTLPEVARMGSRHPGLKVLAVSLDEDRKKAEGFLADEDVKASGASLDALHDAKREVAERYDLAGMPAAVLIDRKGVLRARFDGYTERDLKKMEAEARKLLEEKP